MCDHYSAIPPYTTARVHTARFCAVGCFDPLLCRHPYTVNRISATCFGAMCVGALGDPLLYRAAPPTTLHLGCMLPVFARLVV